MLATRWLFYQHAILRMIPIPEISASPARRRVGLLRRLAAILYDTILLTAVLFFASLLLVVPLQITLDHPLYPFYVFLIYATSFIFFGWSWTHGGQTLGMKTWRFRIEQDNGEPITWLQAALRFLSALVSWSTLGAGFFWCVFSSDGLAFHDALSGTHLVRTD
jgi:uncharacterized RDD family membrane protein YckC